MAGNRTAIVVPGHGWLDLDGEHRISERCIRLVREAEELVSGARADVVVFSGWSSTGGPSEAEQMRDAWRGPAAELVVRLRLGHDQALTRFRRFPGAVPVCGGASS